MGHYSDNYDADAEKQKQQDQLWEDRESKPTGQTIGTVTAEFAPDKVTCGFAKDKVTCHYKK